MDNMKTRDINILRKYKIWDNVIQKPKKLDSLIENQIDPSKSERWNYDTANYHGCSGCGNCSAPD